MLKGSGGADEAPLDEANGFMGSWKKKKNTSGQNSSLCASRGQGRCLNSLPSFIAEGTARNVNRHSVTLLIFT